MSLSRGLGARGVSGDLLGMRSARVCLVLLRSAHRLHSACASFAQRIIPIIVHSRIGGFAQPHSGICEVAWLPGDRERSALKHVQYVDCQMVYVVVYRSHSFMCVGCRGAGGVCDVVGEQYCPWDLRFLSGVYSVLLCLCCCVCVVV